MASDKSDDIEAALAAAYASEPKDSPQRSAVSRRRAAEHRASEPMDGRQLRYIGRTLQLNTRLKPEVREALDAAVQEYGAPIAYIVEHGIMLWIAAQERKRRQ